jgi:hypothetical protein
MENKQDKKKSFSKMLESCYTYGGIGRENYNFGRYLQKYEDILGIQLFNEIYQQESQRLKGYKIEPCTYTDSDGLTYNTLIKH